jgi:hypothetical protein
VCGGNDPPSVCGREFRSSLASLKGSSELLGCRRLELDEVVLVDLSAVIDRQAARVAWLVRLLEAVDGEAPPAGSKKSTPRPSPARRPPAAR